MPQEEKEKIKIVPLCRNIGEVIALNGIIFLMKGLWSGFADHWFVAAMIAWLMIAGFDVWYIEKVIDIAKIIRNAVSDRYSIKQ